MEIMLGHEIVTVHAASERRAKCCNHQPKVHTLKYLKYTIITFSHKYYTAAGPAAPIPISLLLCWDISQFRRDLQKARNLEQTWNINTV